MSDPTAGQQSPQPPPQQPAQGPAAQPPKLSPDLQRRVDVATAKTAEANARAAAAAARQAEIKADSDAAADRLTQLKSLVPDLSSVKTSTVDVKDATPIWGSLLTYAALEKIGATIAKRIHAVVPDSAASILVTGDADLAASDATYNEVTTGLEQLDTAAASLIADLEAAGKTKAEFIAPILVAQFAAAALPGILSLFSTDRTVSTAVTAASDLAAAAPVAEALRRDGLTLVHDGFRLLPKGGVFKQLTDVEGKRTQLSHWQLTLSDAQNVADAQIAELAAAHHPNEEKITKLTQESKDDATRLDALKNLLTAIDAFSAGLRAVPQGATRSPLATAALHEELHGGTPRFGYALLVKAQAGQSQQELTQHRFLREDKFSTTSNISVTYMLIETSGSSILAAGTVTGVLSAHGTIGDQPNVDPPDIIP